VTKDQVGGRVRIRKADLEYSETQMPSIVDVRHRFWE